MFIPTPDKNERLLKYALIGFGVVLVLAFLSVLFSPMQAPLPSGMGKANQETALTPETELKLQEQVSPLIKTGDMAACDQVQNDMYRKVCINNIALNKAEETKDIAFCQYLDNELISRDTCEWQIVLAKSLESENISACAEASSAMLRSECEQAFPYALAQEKQDPSVCQQATDPVLCADQYELTNFMKNPGTAACSNFSTNQVRADCAAMQALFVDNMTPDKERLATICQDVKSEQFSTLCQQTKTQKATVVSE